MRSIWNCGHSKVSIPKNKKSLHKFVVVLDATSKINSGLWNGNAHFFGDYDQCLSIEHNTHNNTIRGQYCTAVLSVDPNVLNGDMQFLKLQHVLHSLSNFLQLIQTFLACENCQWTKVWGNFWTLEKCKRRLRNLRTQIVFAKRLGNTATKRKKEVQATNNSVFWGRSVCL